MADKRKKIINTIIEECFWGEYAVTTEFIIDRLDKNDTDFKKFLFSKIIQNSRYPSHYIRMLFPPAFYKPLIEEYLQTAKDKKRIRLINANLTGKYDDIQGYQWRH
jgi:hypothetical protein